MGTDTTPGMAGMALRIALAVGGFGLILLVAVQVGGAPAAADMGAPAALQRLPGSLAIGVATLGLLYVLWRTLGPRDGDVLGLGLLRQAWKPVVAGVLLWAVPAAVTLAVMQAMGLAELEMNAPAGTVLALIGIHLLAVLLAEALPEELVFRGYVAGLLERRVRLLGTLAVQTALFVGVAWVVRGGAIATADIVMLVALGAVFGYLRARSGTVWLGVGVHLGFQTASQMLIGGWKGPLALGGEPMVAMLVLGAVPFTIAVNLADYVIRTRPQWLGVQRPGLAVEVAR